MEMIKKNQFSTFFYAGNVIPSSFENKVNRPLNLQLADLDMLFMRSIVDEPVSGGPSNSDFEFSLDDLLPPLHPQLDDLDEFMMSISDQLVPVGPSPADFAISSADFLLSLDDLGLEDPQATSSVKTDFPEPEEDFLEMDDLIGSEPTGDFFANPNQALENYFDGLLLSDLFEDADMFSCDEDSKDQGLVSPHYVNPASNYNLETNNANLKNGKYDQKQCTMPAQGGTIAPMIPSFRGNSANRHIVADQNDGEKHDDDTDSWISSLLWSFVESIPASPASAAETALVNCSFDRMSILSRVRISPRSSKVASATSSSSGKCTSGFFSFSVLGFLLAVMWMLAGVCL